MPSDAASLLRLMDMGGGLEKSLTNPLYGEKLKEIDIDTTRKWVYELAERGLITKIRSTDDDKIDNIINLGCRDKKPAEKIKRIKPRESKKPGASRLFCVCVLSRLSTDCLAGPLGAEPNSFLSAD